MTWNVNICLCFLLKNLARKGLTPSDCRRTPWRATRSYVSPEVDLGRYPMGPRRPVNIDLGILPKFCFIHSLPQPQKRDNYDMLCGRYLAGSVHIPNTNFFINVPADVPCRCCSNNADDKVRYSSEKYFSWHSFCCCNNDIPGELDKSHYCLCPRCLRRQDMSIHGIN